MNIKHLSPEFAVSDQIHAADVKALAGMGFKAIICNRPDGEEPTQSSSQAIHRAAVEAGLDFRDIPVVPDQITGADIGAFDKALSELPRGILAYCRTGGRAAKLWSLVQESRRAG